MFRSAFILLVLLSIAVYAFPDNYFEDLLFEDGIAIAPPHRLQKRGNIVNAGHVKKQTIFNVDNGRGGGRWIYPSVDGGKSGTGGGSQSGTGGGAQDGSGGGDQGGTGGGAQDAAGGTGSDGKGGRDGKDKASKGETGEGGKGKGRVKNMKIKIKDIGGS
uniref:Uncharacterized protein n=1 Tax=Homalodisca liturata TaxID=320908 RepID=A0A1B6IQD1_9HEMI